MRGKIEHAKFVSTILLRHLYTNLAFRHYDQPKRLSFRLSIVSIQYESKCLSLLSRTFDGVSQTWLNRIGPNP